MPEKRCSESIEVFLAFLREMSEQRRIAEADEQLANDETQDILHRLEMYDDITQCPHHCDGCHSSVLAEDFGNYLRDDIERILKEYGGYITCICLMGGDQHMDDLANILGYIKEHTELKTAVYSGSERVDLFKRVLPMLDYLKIGPYRNRLVGSHLREPTRGSMYGMMMVSGRIVQIGSGRCSNDDSDSEKPCMVSRGACSFHG